MPAPAFRQRMPPVLLSPTRPALRFGEIAFSFKPPLVLVCAAYSATLVLAVIFKPQCIGKHRHLWRADQGRDCGAAEVQRIAENAPRRLGLKKQIEAGQYPGIVKATLDGVNQLDYLTGKSEKSAREVFYYFAGATQATKP